MNAQRKTPTVIETQPIPRCVGGVRRWMLALIRAYLKADGSRSLDVMRRELDGSITEAEHAEACGVTVRKRWQDFVGEEDQKAMERVMAVLESSRLPLCRNDIRTRAGMGYERLARAVTSLHRRGEIVAIGKNPTCFARRIASGEAEKSEGGRFMFPFERNA